MRNYSFLFYIRRNIQPDSAYYSDFSFSSLASSQILNLFEDFITDFQGPFILSLHLSTYFLLVLFLLTILNGWAQTHVQFKVTAD